MKRMRDYDKFSKYYDAIMGDRSADTDRLARMIRNASPSATSVLELACGTGILMQGLSKSYKMVGIDRSLGMLAEARRRMPRAILIEGDMRTFTLPEKVDVVVCPFDSINHLSSFSDWQAVFEAVRKSLKPGGVFIFDINTIGRLEALSNGRPWLNYFSANDFLIMKVQEIKSQKFLWDVGVYIQKAKDRYALITERITQVSFPISRIKTALLRTFKKVSVLDARGKPASLHSKERVYFICKL